MGSRKLIISLRYLSIFLLILGMAAFRRDNVDIIAVVLVLLFVINNQIRFFILDKHIKLVVTSIIIEVIIAYICYERYGGVEFSYFFCAALDGAFLLEGIITYLINPLIILFMIILGKGLSLSEILSGVATLVTLSILSIFIREENNRKLNAQELYDKLKISEDRLRRANADLENYASSVEELTLLRERNRISREIHDSIGHSLSTIVVQLLAIEKIAGQNGEEASRVAGELRDFTKGTLEEVRAAMRQLKPSEFHKYEGILSLEELIRNFTKLTGIDVRLGFTKEKWPLRSEDSFVIYRVAQEFLSNSLRHGKATRVNIFMNFTSDNLAITFQDNGVGSDNITKGIGLSSIYERVNELGGSVIYNTKKNEGFLLRVVLRQRDNLVF